MIHHNPACGASRNALALPRNAGIKSHVVEYLKTQPSRERLHRLGGQPVVDEAGRRVGLA